jgi:hypothetical protein
MQGGVSPDTGKFGNITPSRMIIINRKIQKEEGDDRQCERNSDRNK